MSKEFILCILFGLISTAFNPCIVQRRIQTAKSTLDQRRM